MLALRRLVLRVLSCVRSGRAEADLAREIEAHLRLVEDQFIAKGMSARDARLAAKRAFGGVDQAKERQRDARSFRTLTESWLDFKLAARMFVKYPGLSLVGGLGMAVAIAIGACFFTLLYSYLQPPVPLDEGDRIVAIVVRDTETNRVEWRTLHDFATWRADLRSLQDLGAFRTVRRNLVVPGGAVDLPAVAEMTASGFRMARVAPLMGRTLLDDDERESSPPVVVIGYDVWRTRFASDPAVVGRTVRLANTVHTIVGVMPGGFAFPVNHRLWVPLRARLSDYERRQGPSLQVFGRLAPGVTREQAQAELTALGQQAATAFPATDAHLRPRLMHYTTMFGPVPSGDVARWQIHLMQSLVSLLLVIVGANVAVLVYARTATRQGEIAVRTALGASRGRIVAQLFIEALVLSSASAVLGLALAAFAMAQVHAYVSKVTMPPFWMHPRLSFGAVVYAVVLTLVAAVIAGVLPALQATGRRMQAGLRQLGGSTGLRLGKTWTAMIVVQVAIAVAILPGVIFQGWDMVRYALVDTGFHAEQFLSARLSMDRERPPASDPETFRQALTAQYGDRQTELMARLRAEPEVAAVTFGLAPPGSERTVWIEIEGVATPAAPISSYAVRSGKSGHEVRFNHVDVDYFDALGVAVLAGRRFARSDVNGSTAIVNRSFAQQFFGDGNPLGRRFRYVGRSGDARTEDVEFDRWYDIGAVVADFPTHAMEPGSADGKVYHPVAPGGAYPSNLIVRMRGTAMPASFAGRLREIGATLDATLRVEDVLPLDAVLKETQEMIRLGALAFTLITVSVLLLSAAGIYALMSFTIAQRRKEIGIRTALGADARRLLGTIFFRASRQLVAGVVAGGLVAALLEKLSEGDMLGGHGALVIPVIAILMTGVGLLAALGPARRALRIDPTEALRQQ